MSVDLVVATKNRGKFREIELALAGLPLTLKFLGDLPNLPPSVEDQPTFEENAIKKAREVGRQTGLAALGDDSGLVIPALEGRPGLFSARYAGPDATDRQNCEKVLREMEEIGEERRAASFICVLALVLPPDRLMIAEGRCEGRILTAPRGEGGFGYDPIFFLPELGMTMAEIPLEKKNRISHRGRALAQLRSKLLQVLK